MGRALLINTAEQEETRAALVIEGRVEAYRRERAATATRVGNIYLGRVVNLETGIGAAFVNIGVGRNAFLHASDCVGADPEGEPRIEEHLVVGQEVLV
ncbi:MAG: Rne/Rng family ribonuclease, partial [Planctomycetota bacterium]